MALVVKNPPASSTNMGLIPGLGRSPGGGNGNPLQYFCVENPIDGGAKWATVKRVAKSQTQLSTQNKDINILRKKKFGWTISLSCQVIDSRAWDENFD